MDCCVLVMGQTQQTESCEEIDVKALQDMYKKFVTECPSGVLFLHEFKRFFGVDPTGEAAEYAESMFRAFDKNGVRKQNCHSLFSCTSSQVLNCDKIVSL